MSIYNDYNCCGPGVDDRGHFNDPSDLVQSNVFQEENPITAALIAEGVFEFSFDAKAGDISGSSTAIAFIRTLDPNAGFALTNDITVDTTDLADDWERLTLSIDLSDPLLEGQILQFGFATEASNFEPSNNFYDNLEFCPAP